MDINSLGAIVGCTIGIAGGIAGTYCGIKAAKHPKQKALAIKLAIICWLAILLLLTLLTTSLAWFSTAQAYIPETIDDIDMHCAKESEPIPWAYCINKQRGSNNTDVLYYLHARNGNETWWNDRHYHTGKLYQQWRDAGLLAPTVVSISFGEQWVLTENPDEKNGGLYTQLIEQVIPTLEKKLAYPKGKRMLAGISMGGFNTLVVAMKSKHFFHKAAALCAPLYNGSHHDGLLLTAQKFFKSDTSLKRAAMLWGFSQRYYPQLKDWQNNDPLALSASFDPRGAPEIYLSCGQNDDWGCMQSSQILVDSIKKNSGNIQWVPRPGGHCDIDHRSLALFLQ